MNKKIIIALFLIIGMVIGFFISNTYNINKCNNKIKATYDRAWEDAQNRLKERGIFGLSGNNNFYRDLVNGEIIKINQDILAIKIVPLEILAKPDLDVREVKIIEDTKIIRIQKKSENEHQKDIEDYYLKNPEQKNRPDIPKDFPSMFINIDAVISDFQIGQKVTIKANEDIVNKKSFIASEVIIASID
jgi:hypothetical protein